MKKFYIKDNVCTPYKLILHRVSNFLCANDWMNVNNVKDADIAIIGCCGAFHSLGTESLNLIKETKNIKTETIVFGCLTNIWPEKIQDLKPDKIISAFEWQKFELLIENPKVKLNDIPLTNEFKEKEEYRLYDSGKKFVLIQTGCSSECPYCPHKLGIGDLKSRPLDEIINQIKSFSEQSTHTIILHGNDTGSYGTDIETSTFPQLVNKVLEFNFNIHLTQVNADWAYFYREELFELLLNKKIKDFQVLIQTVSGRLLKLMERKSVVKELKSYLKTIKDKRKDLLLRTDILIGYPTATIEEEQETLEYVSEIFDEVAVHGFERFEHARIEKMGMSFYSKEEIKLRVEKALEYLGKNSNIIVHRGGQVYQTLVDIEKPKENMRETKKCQMN